MPLTDLLTTLAARRPGHALPRELYTSEAAHRLDTEWLFAREWLFAMPACEIPNVGDRAALQVGPYPVLVVRDDTGSVRAFHNSCRHRGSRLCTEGRATSGPKLVCPYHQWTYGLDGALEFAREPGPDFDTSAFALGRIACRSAGGLVWICLADQPPRFEPFGGALDHYLAPHALDSARIAACDTMVEHGNWKLVLENNRECYHCAGSHPSLIRTWSDRPVMAAGGAVAPEVERHWARCEQAGLPSRYTAGPQAQWRLARMPLLGKATSLTLDGRPASTRRLGDVPFDDCGSLLLYSYPSTWCHVLADHAVLFRLLPVAPDRSELVTWWLVHGDAEEGVDYDVERLTEVWRATNHEDRGVVEENHHGVASPAYQPGPYSTVHEASVLQFVDWYADTVSAAQGTGTGKALRAAPGNVPTGAPHANERIDRLATGRRTLPLVAVPIARFEAPPGQATLLEDSAPAAGVEPLVEPCLPATRTASANRAVWHDDEPLECISRVFESADTVSFGFRSPSDARFEYRSGQFVTLELPLPGGVVQRTYTLSSSPSRPLSISVTVKAQPGSAGSRWMLDELRPGMRLRARGPAGMFSHELHPADRYLMIAAGSGITPMMSMIATLFDRGSDADIVLIACARTPADLLFRRRLELMATRMPGLQLHFVVSQDAPHEAWTGYRGRLNRLMLGLMAPDYLDGETFCCGPRGFMDSVRDMLVALGHDLQRYHQESFAAPATTAEERAAAYAPIEDDLPPAEIVFVGADGKPQGSVHRPGNETLLDAARAAGVFVPSSCTIGVCGTCRVRKRSGEVCMVHGGGIDAAAIAAGDVLACCSRPLGRVEIEIG